MPAFGIYAPFTCRPCTQRRTMVPITRDPSRATQISHRPFACEARILLSVIEQRDLENQDSQKAGSCSISCSVARPNVHPRMGWIGKRGGFVSRRRGGCDVAQEDARPNQVGEHGLFVQNPITVYKGRYLRPSAFTLEKVTCFLPNILVQADGG